MTKTKKDPWKTKPLHELASVNPWAEPSYYEQRTANNNWVLIVYGLLILIGTVMIIIAANVN